MQPSARLLLRRIALGLPLTPVRVAVGSAVLALGCSSGGGSCPAPIGTTTHAIDEDQFAQLYPHGYDPSVYDYQACQDLCRALDVLHTIDAGNGVDPGDAGYGALFYTTAACRTTPPDAGPFVVMCTYSPTCIGGRAPSGLLDAAVAASGVAGWLARAAYLEAASVTAFDELAADLAHHHAPTHLVRAAHAAADDERRHARSIAELATRRGAIVPAVGRTTTSQRSLSALAGQNAVEGCVREAFGALVATRQAVHACDRDVREAYASIRADEARHALLSFAIHDWTQRALPSAKAQAVEARRREQLETWRFAAIEDAPTRDVLGLPSESERDALLRALA